MTTNVFKSYKFRIYPDIAQKQLLSQTFGCVRLVWNELVANFNLYGSDEFVDRLSEKQVKEKYEFMSEVSAASLQQKRMDFSETKSQYFNKKRKVSLGRMRFKKKGVSNDSYRLPNQKFSLDQERSTIRLEKIGHVPVILDRAIPVDAEYRSVTVSRSKSNKYYVSILVKTNAHLLPLTGKSVGIDLGLKDLLVCSNGDVVNNPRWFRESQSKLSQAQRHLSRKQKGSNRYQRQKVKVARVHESIANKRKHLLHCISTALVREFDVISMEDLNIAGMKRSTLGKSVSDASWSEFVRQLKYKCAWYGKSFVQIDRYFPSSKTCSTCGEKQEKMPLHVREWECDTCGTHHDRDLNAATNILLKGYSDLTGLSLSKTSAELVDNKRGVDVRLGWVIDPTIAAAAKRSDKFIDLS
jgi:putative transposase